MFVILLEVSFVDVRILCSKSRDAIHTALTTGFCLIAVRVTNTVSVGGVKAEAELAGLVYVHLPLGEGLGLWLLLESVILKLAF